MSSCHCHHHKYTVLLVTWYVHWYSYKTLICTNIPICASQMYGIYVKFGRHIYFLDIYGNKIWSRCCSVLCFVTCKHHYWIYLPLQNEGSVTYICSVAAIFVQWYANNIKYSLQNMGTALLIIWLMQVTSYMIQICKYIPIYVPGRHAIYGTYMVFMWNVGIFVSS